MSFDFAAFDAVFPWFFPTTAFLLGAIVGSFLNVVVYRLPLGKSVVRPGSHCACGQPIAWYDNIPIVSWLILRGRARCCGRRYSFRYAFVEALTGTLFLICWLQHPPATAAAGFLFVSLLVAALFIDLDHMIIPDVLTIGGAIVGVLIAFLVPQLHRPEGGEFFVLESVRSGVSAIIGTLIGSGLVLWIALLAEAVLRKEAMGFGDVKFVGMVGAFCGWQGTVFSIFGGAIIGTVWIGIALVWQRIAGRSAPVAPRSETPDGQPSDLRFGAHVPFGPMLAVGAAVYFLWAAPWMDGYLAEFAQMF
ncbi:MAG TPA: prepilin peptidase [Candidatus Synoicihabitans sp.]|nr:prepilin peptidase [Candidatus Synoicihabitans sp.]